jgi:membrane-associated protease RseP (regulator of RpoE activity)
MASFCWHDTRNALMVRIFLPMLLATSIFLNAFSPNSVQAQGLFEQLEKKLEKALPAPIAPPEPKDDSVNEALPPPQPKVLLQPKEAATPGYLGARIDDDVAGGLRVLEVLKGSPAEAGGLLPGDAIVRVNGAAVNNVSQFSTHMGGQPNGTKLEIEVNRGGKMFALPITLGAPPVTTRSNDPRVVGSPSYHGSLGVTVAPVTDEARHLYRLSVRNGALIGSIYPGSAADQAGLPLGGVIVAAEGRRIDTPEDLIELIRSRKPGDDVILSYYQGGTLYRKTVRLGVAEGQIVVPGDTPPGLGDRPVLRRLEKALDGLTRPAPGSPVAPLISSHEEIATLRAELETLRTQMQSLEARIKTLEQAAKP